MYVARVLTLFTTTHSACLSVRRSTESTPVYVVLQKAFEKTEGISEIGYYLEKMHYVIIIGYSLVLLLAHPDLSSDYFFASDLEVFRGLLVDPSFPCGFESAGLAGEFLV
jgi:hypothetical protein